MFLLERNRSLLMLTCTLIPLCFELVAGNDMVYVVDWNVTLFVFLYTAFAFQATSCKGNSLVKFQVLDGCAKVGLLVAVLYCWLTFWRGIQQSIVTCLLVDMEYSTEKGISKCREGGLVSRCLNALNAINDLNKISTNCPQIVLGSFIGNLYMAIVICFRCIAVGVVGIWNLCSWDISRYGSSKHQEAPNHIRTRAPSTKHIVTMILFLFPCILVEVAIPHIMPISTIGVTIMQLVIFGLQYVIKTGGTRTQVRSSLITVQKVLVCSAIFYALLDFVMQCIRLMHSCLSSDIQGESVSEACANAKNQIEVEHCYSLLEDIQPSFFTSDKCPNLREDTAAMVILYLANSIKILLLTIGNAIVFFHKA